MSGNTSNPYLLHYPRLQEMRPLHLHIYSCRVGTGGHFSDPNSINSKTELALATALCIKIQKT